MQTKSAILRWLLEGWTMYIRGGLDNFAEKAPDEVIAESFSVHSEMLALDGYLKEVCVVDRNEKESSGRLFAGYQLWVSNSKIPRIDQLSRKAFGSELKNAGFSSVERERMEMQDGSKKQVTMWYGVRLNDEIRKTVLENEWARGSV